MSRLLLRSGLILLILSTLGLLAYAASTLLFPPDDGTRFPQLDAPGTILSALETISSDTLSGTVRNTQQLGGIPASQFVIAGAGRAIDCGSSQHLIGISPAMTAMCGTRGSTLLVLSVIYEASGIGVRRADGTTVSPAAVGTPIYEGDEVFTTTGTGTILFPDDTIVRLDSATQLTLTSGTGIHLEGGSLWARVLGDGGSYSIGTDDLAVGVRGTSLYLSKVAAAPTKALILDSSAGDGVAVARVTCIASGAEKNLSTQKIVTATTTSCAAAPVNGKLSKDAFSEFAFVRRSQRADLVYLKRLKDEKYTDLRFDQVRGSLDSLPTVDADGATLIDRSRFSALLSTRTSARLAKVTTEYNVSKPIDSTEATKLYCTEQPGTVWWNDLGKCVESEVLAVADYTNGDGKMYFKGGTSIAPTNFAQPLTTGKYIEYSTGELLSRLGSFGGKKMKIEWSGTIPTVGDHILFKLQNNPTLTVANYYNGTWYCKRSGADISPCLSNNIHSLPDSMHAFVIGNDIASAKDKPFGGVIKKIMIIE